MSFIGIIASEKQVNEIKKIIGRIIEKADNKNEIEIIAINDKSIENLINIKFETIVIIDKINKLYDKKQLLRQIISKAKYLVLNSDLDIREDILSEINTKTITYGLKQKATITASSISDENMIVCIQRQIKGINEDIIETNETKIRMPKDKKMYEILAIYTIIILYKIQISLKLLEKVNFFEKN